MLSRDMRCVNGGGGGWGWQIVLHAVSTLWNLGAEDENDQALMEALPLVHATLTAHMENERVVNACCGFLNNEVCMCVWSQRTLLCL